MKKCRLINNSLRARLISKTYEPAFFHIGECATYQPAIDQSNWPIQTVISIVRFEIIILQDQIFAGIVYVQVC